jgi:hypothetical protein
MQIILQLNKITSDNGNSFVPSPNSNFMKKRICIVLYLLYIYLLLITLLLLLTVLPSWNKEINSFTYLLTLSSEFKK